MRVVKIKTLKLKDIVDRNYRMNKIIKRLSNKHWFELMLDDYLEKREAEKEKIYKDRFSPSIAANCPRFIQLTMDAVEEETQKTGITTRKLDAGNDMHSRYKKYFNDMGILVSSEVEIRLDDPPVHGFIDAIIKSGGKEWLVELKSRAHEIAGILWVDFKAPPIAHEVQWQMYAKFYGIHNGFILVENKSNNAIKIFDRQLDEAFLEPYLKAWNDIIVARSEGIVVAIPEGGCSNSRYCSYKKYCAAIETGKILNEIS